MLFFAVFLCTLGLIVTRFFFFASNQIKHLNNSNKYTVKVHLYYAAIALPTHAILLHFNLKCSDAALTCGRDVIDISTPQPNCGVA